MPITNLGGIRQVAYVVRDIHRTMKVWTETMGVGPWFYLEDAGFTEFRYRGRPSAIPKLAIAIANAGDLQIELMEAKDDAPSLYRDYLAAHGEGQQHVAYWTAEYERHAREFEAAGYVEGHGGRIGTRGRFAYYTHEQIPGQVIELFEPTGGAAEFMQVVAAAAKDWDGRDPVRPIVRS